MVSFRNSQFRAIVISLVITDAVSQGRLPWELNTATAIHCPGKASAAVDLADDRWCQAIAMQLQSCDSINGSVTLQPQPGSIPSEAIASPVDLLIRLPQLLSQLDLPSDSMYGPAGGPASAIAPRVMTAFHDCLQACLNQDLSALAFCHERFIQLPESGQAKGIAALAQAIELVLAASGDMQLAVGQSLYWPTAIAGLPLLTGILSAAWGGLGSVPCRHRLWLEQPTDDLQAWLQQRWHIPQATTLSAWALTLWQRWAGQALATTSLPLPAVVMPLSIHSENSSL